MVSKMRFGTAVAVAVLAAGIAKPADAAPIDADITFVIDSSGSMGGEFSFLGGAIEGFLNDLQADSRIGSAQAALVSYLSSPTLEQDLTGDATALSAAFSGVSASGAIENAFGAVDAALPGGNSDLGISYRPGSTRSIVLITDEDSDDGLSGSSVPYSNSFGTGSATGDLEALLDSEGFLNNVIYDPNAFSDPAADFEPIARPSGATFSIESFRTDREGFFQTFTATKIQEITTTVPLPPSLALLAIGLLGLVTAGFPRRVRA